MTRSSRWPRRRSDEADGPFPISNSDRRRAREGQFESGADSKLYQFPRPVWPVAGPLTNLSAPAVGPVRQAPREGVPAEVAMVRRRPGQGVRVVREDFVFNGTQAVTEDLPDDRVGPAPRDDFFDRVVIDVADRELIEVTREAAAGLHFPLGRHDQRLPGALAVIFLEPRPVPRIAGQRFGPLDRGQVVPVQRHREIVADKQVAMEHVTPVDHGVQFGGEFADRLQALVRGPARVAEGQDGVAIKNPAGHAAELGEFGDVDAVEFIDAQAEFAGEAHVPQFGED